MKTILQKRSTCPINFALEEVGDIWSLLIIRDILLFSKTSYGEFLSSEEKIATNILASRLEKLLFNGIITKVSNASDKRKTVYALTQKGTDLYPIMKEMMLWSKKYDSNTGIPEDLVKVLYEENQDAAIKIFKESLKVYIKK